jgi:hypothetical protein
MSNIQHPFWLLVIGLTWFTYGFPMLPKLHNDLPRGLLKVAYAIYGLHKGYLKA